MIVPCIVNSWLYCSRLTNCMSGLGELGAHDQRHHARPIRKNPNEVMKYR